MIKNIFKFNRNINAHLIIIIWNMLICILYAITNNLIYVYISIFLMLIIAIIYKKK